jgi:hypothetical protein
MITYRPPIRFKTEHQKAQFDLIGNKHGLNPHVRAIYLEANYFTVCQFNKSIPITNVFEGNDKSPHPHGNAIDCRSFHLSIRERYILLEHINKHFPYRSWGKLLGRKTMIWHDVGKGEHFHIQAGR